MATFKSYQIFKSILASFKIDFRNFILLKGMQVGKFAEFIITSTGLMRANAGAVLKTNVLMTFIKRRKSLCEKMIF